MVLDAAQVMRAAAHLVVAEEHPQGGVLLKGQGADAQQHAQDVTVRQRALKQGPP